MPPTNAPKNCEVEYNPIAKPRLSSVAILDISEGNIASIALKAIKNSVSKIENVRQVLTK
jgi:hypothetical protein